MRKQNYFNVQIPISNLLVDFIGCYVTPNHPGVFRGARVKKIAVKPLEFFIIEAINYNQNLKQAPFIKPHQWDGLSINLDTTSDAKTWTSATLYLSLNCNHVLLQSGFAVLLNFFDESAGAMRDALKNNPQDYYDAWLAHQVGVYARHLDANLSSTRTAGAEQDSRAIRPPPRAADFGGLHYFQ